MGSFRVISQRTGRMATLAALVVATLGQGLLPALASADSVTSRSIALSSSSASATNVTYNVNFTTSSAHAAGAFVMEFCSNSPVIGQACTAPAGMVATGVTTSTSGATISTTTVPTANKLVVVKAMPVSTAVNVTLANITNPSATGPLYARIVTYQADADTAGYTTTALGSNSVDQGGVAMNITSDVNVSGVVQESMSFCVSAAAISANCTGATTPTLKLGNGSGALDSAAVYTGQLYTQISTNAANGAVVSLKSDTAACGGLHRTGDAYDAAHCYIQPASATHNVALGTPYFGVKTSANDVDATNGTYEAVTASGYNTTTYLMNFDSAHPTAPTSGVTSTYGDPILDTAGAPANNRNMQLTFGAGVSNNTPAGTYQAKLGLIATGTF